MTTDVQSSASRSLPETGDSSSDAGYTLVEVLVAMSIMLIGVLGTLGLLTGAFDSTARTSAREQGTNLARDLVERSRQVSYSATTASSAAAALRATLPSSDAASALQSNGSFTVTRRGTTYTVRVTACSVDDPANGVGLASAGFCAARTNPGPGTPDDPTETAIGLNVLGIAVSTAGSLLNTVCGVVGTNTALLNTVSGLVGGVLAVAGGADVQVCPGSASTQVPLQYGTPDDFHRVRVRVSWTRGSAGTVAQTVLLPNPA